MGDYRKLTSTHFIPVRTNYIVAKLAKMYVGEIFKLHGVSSSIISDRNTKFTSHSWGELHEALGTKFRLNYAYHPQTDRQTKMITQTL